MSSSIRKITSYSKFTWTIQNFPKLNFDGHVSPVFSVGSYQWWAGMSSKQIPMDIYETCYLLKGKVKVIPYDENEFVEFGAGDLVEFPQGMNCTWDVTETVDKHYKFE
ncbi:hypothetical protein MKX01_015420 [Papaver californicum]|nr:hypothetical protein MKX01_015420 [Papaver californicum]